MKIPEDAPVMVAFREYSNRVVALGIAPTDFDWFRVGFIFGATQAKKAIDETERIESELADRNLKKEWCQRCGCGSDKYGYAHLPSCGHK